MQSGQALGSPNNHCEDHDGDDDDNTDHADDDNEADDDDNDDNDDDDVVSGDHFHPLTHLLFDLFPANVGQHLYLGG